MPESGVEDKKAVEECKQNGNVMDDDFPDFKSAVDNITGPAIVDSDLFMMSHPKWKFVEVSCFYNLRLCA